MYLSGVKNMKFTSNFNTIAPKFNVKTAKSLEDYTNLDHKENSILIKNLGGYEHMKGLIQKNSKLKNYVIDAKRKIIGFLENVYHCIKYEERETYDYIHKLTMETPFIIFNGLKEENKGKKGKKKNILKKSKYDTNNQPVETTNSYSEEIGHHNTIHENKRKSTHLKASNFHQESQNPKDTEVKFKGNNS